MISGFDPIEKKFYFCLMKNFSTFSQLTWLVNTILRANRITLGEISQHWIDSDMANGKPLSRSTFYRYKDIILDMFGIVIECDIENGYYYYVSNPEVLNDNSTRSWMFRTLSISNDLLLGLSIKDRIMLEDIPRGSEYLQVAIMAMKNNHTLVMGYKKFDASEGYKIVIEPYSLKVFHQRWYLIGRSDAKGDCLKTFAFDRMTSLVETTDSFKLEPIFNTDHYFDNYFGIIADPTVKIEHVVIRAYKPTDKYLNTLPLHASQQVVQSTDDYTDFSYDIAPTYDFRQAILREGHYIEVLEPQSFRDEVRNEMLDALKHYGV